MVDETLQMHLIQQAERAQHNAYSPYSNFKVGAAVLLDDGSIFNGCNIENVSFGLSSCAERNAIFRAICQRGKVVIKAIAISNHKQQASPPCGACRQVIAEFSTPETIIIFPQENGYEKKLVSELLPASFDNF